MAKIRTFRWVCLFLIFLVPVTIQETRAVEFIYVSPGESIQAAVNGASSGDTIFVKPGIYNESIQINQDNLTIISESQNPDNTLISSKERESKVFEITAGNVTINGFSIAGGHCGIYLNSVQNCRINNNNISENEIGACLYKSNNNTLNDNTVYSNIYCGIKLVSSAGNTIYDNCFNNTNNVIENKLNTWNLTKGNYWSDYTGADKDGDGIGDTLYVINHQTDSMDYRPLINYTPKSPVFPEAIFTSNVTVGYAPLTVEFTDFSENATSLAWSFRDMAASNSSDFLNRSDILHTFIKEGTYTVTLNVTNENGSDSTNVTIIVLKAQDPSVPALPEAKFSANVTSGYVPLTVQFVDFSENADSLDWSFGDGKSSSCLTPRHTFCCPGNYTVSLRVKNPNGSSSTCTVITVLKPTPTSVPEAKFSASVTTGKAPLTVDFVDLSENAIYWTWDFGDGNKSTQKSPVYTYTTPGNYTVSLKVSNEYGNDLKEIMNLIKVKDANSTPGSDSVFYSQGNYNISNAATNAANEENSNSKSEEEDEGIKKILSKENLESAENFALSVIGTRHPAELISEKENEVIKNGENVKNLIESSVFKTEIKNLLWFILALEMLGIVSIIFVLKRNKKK